MAPALILLAAVAPTLAAASAHIQAKEALWEFFTENGSPPSMERGGVELCPDNTCDFYTLPKPNNAAAWDVVFLHQYYYSGRLPDTNAFRERFASLAAELMAHYGPICPRAAMSSQPGCVIGYLSQKYKIRYAFVRYDEGQRCEMWIHIVHSKTVYGGSCTKVRHAS